jgi:hypothetical protein
MNLHQRFQKVSKDFEEWDRIVHKKSVYPETHVALLLESLIDGEIGKEYIYLIDSLENDKIWLVPAIKDLNKTLTDAHILELVRCGVWCTEADKSLYLSRECAHGY